MSLKLGYLVPEFPQQTHAFFWREAAALRGLGVEPVLLSTRRPPDSACPHAFGIEARAATHYVFPPRPRALGRLLLRPGAALRALAYIANLRETPWWDRLRLFGLIPSSADLAAFCADHEIAHLHAHSFANSAHIAALCNILGGPSYSLTLHGDPKVYGTDHPAKAARAALVTTVTRPLAETMARILPEMPIAVVSMGVDTDRFHPSDAPRTRSSADPFVVATVARLHPLKGHQLFLEAMARLREEGHVINYRIAGSGPAESEIRIAATRLGLSGSVEFLGSLDETDVADVFRAADIAVLPSVMPGEAAPVMVMEAMACGTPVICSRIGGTPDMIDDGVDGILVPQNDITALADATRRLLTEPDLLDVMSDAARRSAVTVFDYRSRAADFLEAVQRATSR